MDTMLLRAFQGQIELQCRFMLSAAAELDRGLKEANPMEVFYAAQNLLNAAANISKALWGAGGRRSTERKPLRDSIGISDTSPLRGVAMRNNFEHFDERLDRWWNESKRHNYVDINIAARSNIEGIDEIDWFRAYDPTTTDLTFWGEDFNLRNLINEIRQILPRLQEEASKPHWD